MGGIVHKEEFYAIKCRKDNIILGLPWLNRVNPTINWINKHVNIHEATDQTEEYNLATSNEPFTIRKATQEPLTHPKLLPWEHEKEEPIYPDENFINYVRGVQYVYTKGTNRFQMINGKLKPLTIAKTSITSKLAQKIEETPITLPKEYAKFAEVFLRKHPRKCHRADPMTTPSSLMKPLSLRSTKSTLYPLMSKKRPTTSSKKTLKQGKSDPPPPHKHCLSSMLERRTLASDPAKTTDTSMNTPSRMPTHYPLSPTSSTW